MNTISNKHEHCAIINERQADILKASGAVEKMPRIIVMERTQEAWIVSPSLKEAVKTFRKRGRPPKTEKNQG